MELAELFARAATALPEAARRRMDGDAPLDWETLDDPGTGAAIDAAIRRGRRLPEPVETLVARLIREVGVVPAAGVTALEIQQQRAQTDQHQQRR